jgi:hypothetical protein
LSRRAKLLELRATAERLALGDHGDRCLRDLFLELVDVLTGQENAADSMALASARAPAPAPELVGVTAGVSLALAPPAGSKRDLPRPAADVPDPAGEQWLAELAAADEKAELEAAAAATAEKTKPKTEPKAAPTPNGGH